MKAGLKETIFIFITPIDKPSSLLVSPQENFFLRHSRDIDLHQLTAKSLWYDLLSAGSSLKDRIALHKRFRFVPSQFWPDIKVWNFPSA
jgi:hypothetical protein